MNNQQKFQNSYEDQNNRTPFNLENLPDEIKPMIEKNYKNQNFDIILTKYLNNEQLTDIELQRLNQHQKIIVKEVKKKVQKKIKRPEEYQKLYYKKVFKYAEHLFFKKNKKFKSRHMSHFYHHHFQTTAHKLNIPITNFYHPDRKTKPGLKTGQKSFNSSYIKLILKSHSFRLICQQYHTKFIKETIKQRNQKIKTFSSSIHSMIEKNKENIMKVIKFMQSSKCKIPWTNQQIQQAYKRAAFNLDGDVVETEDLKQSRKEDKQLLQLVSEGKDNILSSEGGFAYEDVEVLSYAESENSKKYEISLQSDEGDFLKNEFSELGFFY